MILVKRKRRPGRRRKRRPACVYVFTCVTVTAGVAVSGVAVSGRR
jgi:hypothetical protein